MTETIYTEEAMKADAERGYADGLAGRKGNLKGVTWYSAYTTGWGEGNEARKLRIKNERIARLKKTRRER